MSFDQFVRSGHAKFNFGDEMLCVVRKTHNAEVIELNKDFGSYAVYEDGVEYLFEDGMLCLVQYDTSRIECLCFNGHAITSTTRLNDFKSCLDEAGVVYSEAYRDNQVILETDGGVKIYFDESDGLFQTAMKTW
jgi:hypothetical protein